MRTLCLEMLGTQCTTLNVGREVNSAFRVECPASAFFSSTPVELMTLVNSERVGEWLSRRDRATIADRFNAGNQMARESSPDGMVELLALSNEFQPSLSGLGAHGHRPRR